MSGHMLENHDSLRSDAARFFDWCRSNLRACAEKLDGADKREFESGMRMPVRSGLHCWRVAHRERGLELGFKVRLENTVQMTGICYKVDWPVRTDFSSGST